MLVLQNHSYRLSVHPFQRIHAFRILTVQNPIGHAATFGLTERFIQRVFHILLGIRAYRTAGAERLNEIANDLG